MIELIKLNPAWLAVTRLDSGEQLLFDAPCDWLVLPSARRKVVVAIENPVDGLENANWKGVCYIAREGDDFTKLSLAQSVDAGFWHGWIEDGLVYDISESLATLTVKFKDGRQAGPIALSRRQMKQYERIAK